MQDKEDSELTQQVQPAQHSEQGQDITTDDEPEMKRSNDDVIEQGVEELDIEQGVEEHGNDDVIEQGVEDQEWGNDDVTMPAQEGVASSESTDTGPGSIMLAESNLSLNMSSVARATSSDKLGSPVLPITALEEVAIEIGDPQLQENSSSSLLTTNKSPEKEAEPAVSKTPPTFVAEDLERVEEELEGVHLTPSISDSVPDVTIDLEEGVEEGVEPVFPEEDKREGEAPRPLEQQVSGLLVFSPGLPSPLEIHCKFNVTRAI